MANLPANPGEALWIGGAAGKNHYNVGIGGPGGDLDHTDYDQSTIEDGFSLASYFYLDSNGDTVFKQLVENGRTSTGTKYARTELRELTASGAKAAWNGSSGTHYMQGRSKIDHVPSAKPWVCFFQVHDASSDLARIQTEDGAIVCRRTPPGSSSEIRTVIRTSYTIGDWYSWELRIESGTMTVKLDGVTVLTASGMGESGCYFKAGCYNQVNNRSDGGGAATGEYCQVTMQRGSFVTWHSGYPDPTTPVFTGGTDTNGGPGQVGGVDTEPPTSPTGLTVTRTSAGNVLTWNAATDNVGVDHYNIYRSGGV